MLFQSERNRQVLPRCRRNEKPGLIACWLVAVALILSLLPTRATTSTAAPLPQQSAPDTSLGVQAFLDTQPGVLKTYTENGQTAAAIIEMNSLFYGISPYLHLALLETVSSLLSDPNPPQTALRQPYGTAGPEGFAAQIEWASRELRAGYGTYDSPPTLTFPDGKSITLTLNQAPEGVAVQRFLANGRTSSEWRLLVDRFGQVFQEMFHNELPDLSPSAPSGAPLEAPTTGFLHCPWPVGMQVIHLAYFDHTYPTVDSGGDGNSLVVTYAGQASVQYNTHDGHDYVFPDNPVGTPILAAAPGLAYARTARGNGVVILHAGGYETVYWHLNHFAPRFRSVIDRDRGVWVETGDMLGTSGKTGFRSGTPHLHFEVRHNGRQVDPYGWQGGGTDPCTSYAACEDHGWLWHSDLYGMYDFTPVADVSDNGGARIPTPDTTPPIGTLSINPPADLLFLAHFDGHAVQDVGTGFPTTEGTPLFEPGRYHEGLHLPEGSSLTYPISHNLNLEAGSVSLWVRIPDQYTDETTNQYVFAASASPYGSEAGYPGTLALRREPSRTESPPALELLDRITAGRKQQPGCHRHAATGLAPCCGELGCSSRE